MRDCILKKVLYGKAIEIFSGKEASKMDKIN